MKKLMPAIILVAMSLYMTPYANGFEEEEEEGFETEYKPERTAIDEISVKSTPSGASVTTSDGVKHGVTPLTITAKRNSSFQIFIDREGYKRKTIQITPTKTSEGKKSMWGNLVWGGIAGAIKDADEGIMYDLKPDDINVSLELL